METRRIGSLEASVVGLGCNNFGRRLDADATAEVVDAALGAGVNFFDTADVYGDGKSEDYLGRALGERRTQVILATKFGNPMSGRGGASPQYVRQACDDSLHRLATDYIDLYQLHRPDPSVPIGETLGALSELVRAGKVREIGCSNFSLEQLAEDRDAAHRGGTVRFVSVQNEYSLLHREPENGILDECESHGIAFLPYFPLASGLLTGKYRQGQPAPEGTRPAGRSDALSEDKLTTVESLRQFAHTRGHTLLDLAFSWLLSRSVVASVIAGATRADQMRDNVAAARWHLSPDDLAELDSIVPADNSRA